MSSFALGRVGDPAIGADLADQALRDDRQQAVGELVAGDAEVVEVADRARRVGAVDRAEDEHAGQRGADADPGGLVVADLADHDHVGVLAEHRPQALAEAHLARASTCVWLTPGIRCSIGSSIVITFCIGELIRSRQV